MNTPLQDLWDLCQNHDWFFNFSDDHSVWSKGAEEHAKIVNMAKSIPGGLNVYYGWLEFIFSGESFNKPKVARPLRP